MCSVAWTQRGNYLAIGTTKGVVRIYDAAAVRQAIARSRLLHFGGKIKIEDSYD